MAHARGFQRRWPVSGRAAALGAGGAGLAVAVTAAMLGSGPGLAVAWAGAGVLLIWSGVGVGWGALRLAGLFSVLAAALRMVVWESYPDLLGGSMAPLWLRTAGFGAVAAAALSGAALLQRHRGDRRGAGSLLLLAYLVGAWWITFEATLAIDGSHNGRLAGNEGLLVAGVWSLYGVGLAVAERWFSHLSVRQAARAAIGAGLAYLVLGATMANARWALPGYRVFAYSTVLGGAWVAEALFSRYGEDGQVQGLLSLAAAGTGVLAALLETRLWLDAHLFTGAVGTVQSAAHVAFESSTRAYAAVVTLGLWGLGVAAAGRLLRSGRTRLVGAAVAGGALAYCMAAAFRPGAPLALQGAGVLVAGGGAVAAARLMARAAGDRPPLEGQVARWLPLAAAGVGLVWVVMMAVRLVPGP